ncbi:MAG: Cof-type HAD-IIB family hydrolase [Eubacteriales bacterium]|nr:Cof-type HAD-IIB family hydrolase [Eubacteriales bacterium]
MSIKIIAADLDGTLMSTDHLTVTEHTKNVLLKAHDNGVKFAIATGRPLKLIENVIEQVPFADYIIYSNGACVFDRNKNEIIYSDLIDAETAEKIISHFLAEPVFFEIYIDGKSHYQDGTEKYYDSGELPSEFIAAIMSTMTPHKDLLSFAKDKPIEKITMYSISDENYPIYSKWLKDLNLSVAESLKSSIEATTSTADKGNALRGICEEFGIAPEEAMSFGDSGNDCTMLRYAGYSFAMENGSDECKAAAKYQTLSNGNDGVAVAVEKYCLKNQDI